MAGPVTITDFDQLVAEAREEGRQRHSGEHRVSNARRGGPEPTLTLGNYGLTGVDPAVRKRHGVALPASMALHAAAAIAIAIVPLLIVDALPQPEAGTRAFFVEPIAAAAAAPAAAPGGERIRSDPRGPESPGRRSGRLRRAHRAADGDQA